MSWPPEKKSGKSSSAQQANVPIQRNKLSDKDRTAKLFSSPISGHHTDTNKSKISVGAVKTLEREKRLSSSSISRVAERSKMAGFNSAEKLPSVETKPWTVSAKRALFQHSTPKTEVDFSSPHFGKGTSITSKLKIEHTNLTTPAIKSHNSTSDGKTASQSKSKKSVRFAPNVNAANQNDPLSSELRSEAENEDQSKHQSGQSEDHPVDMSKDGKDNSTKMEVEHLSPEFRNKQLESGVIPNPYEYRGLGKTTELTGRRVIVPASSAIEHVKMETSHNMPQTVNKDNVNTLKGLSESYDGNESKAVKEHGNSTLDENIVTHQEPSKKLDIIAENTLNVFDPVDQNMMESQAENETTVKKSPTNNENPIDMGSSVDEQETIVGQNGSQKKGVERSNSLKGFTGQQNDRSNVKKGSWSKGKSPLSMLFTSGGNEKTNKAEPTDKKKPEANPRGFLAKLFQSSEKRAEETKPGMQEERKEITSVQAEDKPVAGVKEEIEEEITGNITDNSLSTDPNPLNSMAVESETTELSPLIKSSVCDITGDVLTIEGPISTAPEQILSVENTDYMNPFGIPETILQSSDAQGLSLIDTSMAVSDDMISSVSAESIAKISEVSSNLTTEKRVDEILGDAFQEIPDNIFGESFSPAPVEPLTMQMDTGNTVHQPNEMVEASELGGSNLGEGMLFHLDDNITKDFPNSLGQGISVNTSGDSTSVFSLSHDLLSADTSAAFLSVHDSQPLSAESEEILGMTGQLIVPDQAPITQESQTSDPFYISATNQTMEQETHFDMFSSEGSIPARPPANHVFDQDGANASSDPKLPDIPDDIFGMSDISTSTDVFTVQMNSNTFGDFLSLNSATIANPTTNDLFSDGIVATEPEMLATPATSDTNVFMDTLLGPVSSHIEQETMKPNTNNSWMDDLLG